MIKDKWFIRKETSHGHVIKRKVYLRKYDSRKKTLLKTRSELFSPTLVT